MTRHLYPFKRYSGNPILTRQDVPYPCNTVFNAAACKFNGQYVLILRIEDLKGRSHLTLGFSDDGYHFDICGAPWICPSSDPKYEVYERYGVEDPRVTRIGEFYYITYTAYGPYGPRVGIGRTADFKHFERLCLATEVDNKDAVLFPEKIGGKYVMLDRPSGSGSREGSIWIAYSPDLIFWGKATAILTPEPGWGNSKLGVSTPPLKTDQGWLVLYHGVRETGGGNLHRIGAMLLDTQNPQQVVGYSSHFIFGPEDTYERIGDVPNVVFPCGIILEDDETVKIYYGAADTCIGLAEAKLADILGLCTGTKIS